MTTSKPNPEIKTFSASYPELSIYCTYDHDSPSTEMRAWIARMQSIAAAARAAPGAMIDATKE